ncbi:MAG: BMP family ABC transporter substrate-binding protein [Burkholderiales bacterium]|nr:BMP family ABC transporter substrate-binding protein [Anaerolineae bacterium]
MKHKTLFTLSLLAAFALLAVIPVLAQDEDFIFGIVLVGPRNDRGWSQAHYEAAEYVTETVPGTDFVYFESLNPADSPESTLRDVVNEMVAQGATLILTTSDEFEEDTDVVAVEFPDTMFVNISGDNVLTGEAPSNVGNLMGQMEWGKLIAGCAAGLKTDTGSIGYLGPLINAETRRLASSAYLGARYCWEHYRGEDPAELDFSVTWIGFWFNIPGVTLDPTEETNTFYDSGADVVISGIDTTEAIVVAGQRHAADETVYAIPYDFAGACEEAPDVCLGVPYFNWGPAYADLVESAQLNEWEQSWEWIGPDWDDINNPDTSVVGFVTGPAMVGRNLDNLEEFIDDLAGYSRLVPNAFALWSGPLNLQDGTELASNGQNVDVLDVWYLGQLLEGMAGASE